MTPPPPPSPLKLQALRGARWTTYATLVSLLLQAAQLLILARWLTPEQLGLAALALLVAQLAQLFVDLGVSNALVSAPQLAPRAVSALWWLSLLGAALVAAGVVLGGGAIAGLYRRPDLEPLLRVVALSLLVAAPGLTHRALLQRALRFKTLAAIDTAAGLAAAAVNLLLVLSGLGVLALAWGAVARAAVLTAGVWRPGRALHRQLSADGPAAEEDSTHHSAPLARPDFAAARPFLRYGAYQLGSVLLSFAGGHADTLLTGRLLGLGPLGLLDTAKNLVLRPMLLTTPVLQRVMLPVLAQVNAAAPAEPERLRQSFVRTLSLLYGVNLPLFAGMALAADPLVRVVLGPQWLGAIPLVPVLCLMGLLRVLVAAATLMALALGRADRAFWANAVLALTGLGGVALGARWGVMGVALAVVLQFVVLAVWGYVMQVRPLTGARLGQVLRPLWPYTRAAALAAGPAALAVALIASPLLALAVAALAYAGVYGLTLWLTHPEARALVALLRQQGLTS